MASFGHDRLFLQLHWPGIKWTNVRGINSDVSTQSRALFSELKSRVQGRVTLYMQKAEKRTTSGGNGDAARKVMCDNKQAIMNYLISVFYDIASIN